MGQEARQMGMAEQDAFASSLRRIREQACVSLGQIAAESKVSRRHLEALETGLYDQLPGGILARGIVRAYLRALHLDESTWMPRFLEAYPAANEQSANEEEWQTFASAVTGAKPSPAGNDQVRFRWWGAFILLALAAVAALLFWHFAARRVTRPASGSSTQHVSDSRAQSTKLPGRMARAA